MERSASHVRWRRRPKRWPSVQSSSGLSVDDPRRRLDTRTDRSALKGSQHDRSAVRGPDLRSSLSSRKRSPGVDLRGALRRSSFSSSSSSSAGGGHRRAPVEEFPPVAPGPSGPLASSVRDRLSPAGTVRLFPGPPSLPTRAPVSLFSLPQTSYGIDPGPLAPSIWAQLTPTQRHRWDKIRRLRRKESAVVSGSSLSAPAESSVSNGPSSSVVGPLVASGSAFPTFHPSVSSVPLAASSPAEAGLSGDGVRSPLAVSGPAVVTPSPLVSPSTATPTSLSPGTISETLRTPSVHLGSSASEGSPGSGSGDARQQSAPPSSATPEAPIVRERRPIGPPARWPPGEWIQSIRASPERTPPSMVAVSPDPSVEPPRMPVSIPLHRFVSPLHPFPSSPPGNGWTATRCDCPPPGSYQAWVTPDGSVWVCLGVGMPALVYPACLRALPGLSDVWM